MSLVSLVTMIWPPESHQPPGFEGVLVALHGASCVAFFEIIFFADGQVYRNDNVTEVSS